MFTVIDNLRACIPLLDLSVLNELKVSPKTKGIEVQLMQVGKEFSFDPKKKMERRRSVIICNV